MGYLIVMIAMIAGMILGVTLGVGVIIFMEVKETLEGKKHYGPKR